VVFEGIVFENGRLDAVEMRSCANVEFRKNIVRNFGRHGITATDARKVRIVNNVFAGFGARAIYVSGGERKTLTPAENVISDNEIAFVERRERTYMPGLAVEGCGMDIARNHFHDMPSSAMRIEGNDYRVVSNLIERVVTESDDQGGIDIYRDPSYAGVFIAYNRFRDIGSPPGADGFASCGQAAVRLDGNVSGMTVYSNVFERCGRSAFGAVQINGGRNNRIEGNRFVDCWSGVSISYFPPMKWTSVMKDLRKLYEERVDIRSPPYSTKYPGIATLDEQTIQTNFVVRNVLVRTENLVSTRSPDVLVYGNTVAYPPEPVSALSEIKNLPYDRSGRETSTGDLFLPTVVSRSSKVVLVIHGGSWSSMSRRDVAGVAEFFRDRLGFAAFNIDYRLASGKNRWPACGEDCVQAAKWLLSEDFAKVSGIRADKIWICGLSAGGHLALWTLNALPSNAVAGAVAISPIGDPKVDFADHPSRYTRLLGDDAEFRLEEMDPCRNVGKKQTPVLITHSREDRVVRIGSSRRFAEAYRNMGGVCQMYEYAGEDEANRGGHAIWRAGVKPVKLLSHIELRIIDFIAGR
jgi:acetyl esterase/lipase